MNAESLLGKANRERSSALDFAEGVSLFNPTIRVLFSKQVIPCYSADIPTPSYFSHS